MQPRALPVSLDDLRRAADTVGRETGSRLIVLFGSAARLPEHGARPPQDLDLGVLNDAASDLVDLTNRFIRALRLQAVDVTDLEAQPRGVHALRLPGRSPLRRYPQVPRVRAR